MLSIYDAASAAAALAEPLNPALRTVITDRLNDAKAIGLADQTHIVVVQPGDTEAMLREELGWSPLTDPISGASYGAAGFTRCWCWFQEVGGWFELLYTIGNSGFAYILLIENADSTCPDLLAMCRAEETDA